MLRITHHTTGDDVVLKLEGSLAGPWVRELAACWHEALSSEGHARLRVDLTDVSHVDAEGQDLMTLMYLAGARFVARGCVMPEILREISEQAVNRFDGRKELTC